MRSYLLALVPLLLLPSAVPATESRYFEDASLQAVQFVDASEGWAVGDEGAVWHTIDGGKSWERQATGVRASLRSVHFVDPFVGWVAGREELPLGAGSSGVLLFTRDGGERWQRVSMNSMPGLNQVRFLSDKIGYVLGDGTDQYPSGVFVTQDGGQSWECAPGPRCPGWYAASFTDAENGALVGAWNHLGSLRKGAVALSKEDFLGGRHVRGVHLSKGGAGRGVAVGQGGLVLLTDRPGTNWSLLEQKLPPEVLSSWDFHTVHGAGSHIWAAGRPGSLLLHSADGGRTWETQSTGQPLPINGLHFLDEKRGWAVGELGLILATSDGGKTWKAQQQGGRRVGLLALQASASGVPVEAIAQVGADEGFLSAAVRILASDSVSSAPGRALEGERLSTALRLAGGAASELLWQFPVPAHLAGADAAQVVEFWESLHGPNAREQILRQLVLAIRIWRPEVILSDLPERRDVPAAELLIAGLVREAFRQAADPEKFPEQLRSLGLQVWKASKLYAPLPEVGGEGVTLDLLALRPRFAGSTRDFAAFSAGLLKEAPTTLPQRRTFRLLDSTVEGANAHTSLMQGVAGGVGESRRRSLPVEELSADLIKALQMRATLETAAETPFQGLTDPGRLLTGLPSMLEKLSPDQGAPATHALAHALVRQGQWVMAREAFLHMVERYPAHPLTADAFRWLIRHNSSSETRRRHELGQFFVAQEFSIRPAKDLPPMPPRGKKDQRTAREVVQATADRMQVDWTTESEKGLIRRPTESTRWHQGSLDLEPRLAGFGPLLSSDPGIQFCLHAARRNLGDFETSRRYWSEFVARQPAGAWREAAAAELWLLNPEGKCPKPLAICRQCETKPFLDGKFDDACWQGLDPIELKNDSGKPGAETRTQAWLAYDQAFLYVAIRCEHAEGKQVPPASGRTRDADLSGHDRVSLFLDLDRDYATTFHFQCDQRGCAREDCWGDVNWNPKWFVASHSEPTFWQIEAAIPLVALSGDIITSGRTWAFNLVRTSPGQGVQSWSLPAGMPEKPRLESMGLLMFQLQPRPEAQRGVPGTQMKRIP